MAGEVRRTAVVGGDVLHQLSQGAAVRLLRLLSSIYGIVTNPPVVPVTSSVVVIMPISSSMMVVVSIASSMMVIMTIPTAVPLILTMLDRDFLNDNPWFLDRY